MAESLADGTDSFSMQQVVQVLDNTVTNRRSLHLPRGAVKASLLCARQLTWALVNLAMSCGLVAAGWAREISPLRKAGPEIVTDPVNLRPVGCITRRAEIFLLGE